MGYKFEKYSIGGGGGSGIIDVTELPEVGVEGSVYKVMGEKSPEMWGVADGDKINFGDMLASDGISPLIYTVDALPDTMEPLNMDNGTFPIYVVNDTGVGYISMDGTSASAMTVATMMFEAEGFDKGWADDIGSIDATVAENMGVYFVRGGAFYTYNTYADGVWTDYIEGEPVRNEIEGLNTEIETLENDKATLTTENETLTHANATLTTENAGLTRANATLTTEIEGLNTEIETLTGANATLAAENETLEAQVAEKAPSANFTDYAVLKGSAEGIILKNVTDKSITCMAISDSVTSIGGNAFSFCTNLKSVMIPDSVTSIGYQAFQACLALASITIPVSVTTIAYNVFSAGYTGRFSIIYNGTKEQWKAITKTEYNGSKWDSGMVDYTITCTDGTIAKDGTET